MGQTPYHVKNLRSLNSGSATMVLLCNCCKDGEIT